MRRSGLWLSALVHQTWASFDGAFYLQTRQLFSCFFLAEGEEKEDNKIAGRFASVQMNNCMKLFRSSTKIKRAQFDRWWPGQSAATSLYRHLSIAPHTIIVSFLILFISNSKFL